MKISNLRAVRILAWFITIFLGTFVVLLFLSQFIPHEFYWNPIFLLVIALLSLSLTQIRYTEIDNSAGCLTIRSRHPFAQKGYVTPKIEFPKSAIRHFQIDDNVFRRKIKIIIQTRAVRKRFQINLFLFKSKQIKQIDNLLRIVQTDI